MVTNRAASVGLAAAAAGGAVIVADRSRTALNASNLPGVQCNPTLSSIITLIYSSGITDNPKAVETTHINLLFAAFAVEAVLGIEFGDRITSFSAFGAPDFSRLSAMPPVPRLD